MAEYFKSPDNPRATSIEFYARATKPQDDGLEKVHPTVEVSLEKGHYEYNQPPFSIDHNYFAKPGEQLKLFDAHPSKITHAFADSSMRSHTPTVLGMAINEAKKIGLGLTHDADLSRHSAKLAKRGIESGVISPNPYNPTASQFNDIALDGLDKYEHSYTPSWFQDFDPIPEAEVRDGRETIRGIVQEHRQARKGHMGPQFNHPDLDKTWHQPTLDEN